MQLRTDKDAIINDMKEQLKESILSGSSLRMKLEDTETNFTKE